MALNARFSAFFTSCMLNLTSPAWQRTPVLAYSEVSPVVFAVLSSLPHPRRQRVKDGSLDHLKPPPFHASLEVRVTAETPDACLDVGGDASVCLSVLRDLLPQSIRGILRLQLQCVFPWA